MFFDPGNNWTRLDPIDILAIRATAPKGVFTPTAKGGYLTQVRGNPEFTALADALFSDDEGFITHLPAQWQQLQPQLLQLMQLAYKSGIRAADLNVKRM